MGHLVKWQSQTHRIPIYRQQGEKVWTNVECLNLHTTYLPLLASVWTHPCGVGLETQASSLAPEQHSSLGGQLRCYRSTWASPRPISWLGTHRSPWDTTLQTPVEKAITHSIVTASLQENESMWTWNIGNWPRDEANTNNHYGLECTALHSDTNLQPLSSAV